MNSGHESHELVFGSTAMAAKAEETAMGNFGPAKSGWKVLAASGHKDPAEAVRRASYAIDHSHTRSWLTDVGQDATGYPHSIVIDLGQETECHAVSINFARDAGAANHCVVKASRSLKNKPIMVATKKWDAYQSYRRIELDKPSKIRYLRLEFDNPYNP